MRLLKHSAIATVAIAFALASYSCGADATHPAVPTLTTISVALTPTTISADQSAIAVASAVDQFGAAFPLSNIVWSSSEPSVATVSAGGFVTAVAAGTTNIIATVGAVSGSSSLTVTVVPVARVVVAPTGIRLAVGATQQFGAALFDVHGNALTGRTVTWSTSDSTKAIVSSTGLVTARANGSVVISASSEGQTGAASLDVGPEPIASITITPPAATIVLGATATFTANALGISGTVLTGRAITWTTNDPSIISISASGASATVTALTPGTASLTATSEGMSGSATVTVTPPPPACPRESALHLAVGEVRALTAAQIASTCLGGDTFSSEYVLIPLNGSPVNGNLARIQVTGTNTSSIASAVMATAGARARTTRATAPAAGKIGRTVPSIAAGELAFKTREQSELASRLASMRGQSHSSKLTRRQLLTSVPTAPVVGAIYNLNADVTTACGLKQLHGARVVAVLPHTIVFVDTLSPAGGYTDAELIAFGTAFDTLGFPLDTLNFGAPTDIDGNGHIGIFFTPGVNVIPAPIGAIVAGLFATRDLLSATGANSCSGSNEGELFYVPVPDLGKTINASYSDKAFLSNTVASVLVHEFQHLINAGRRIYVNNAPVGETTWLNEGLSDMAEELLYYHVSGHSPRTNIGASQILSMPAQITAYHTYMSDGNIQSLGLYLTATEVNSPYSDFDALETRGATWQLLRYAADRKGGPEPSIWRALVNSTTSGLANFNAVFGSIGDMVHDWSIAQFTDDAGLSVPAIYTNPSWNFRSIYRADDDFGVWPLATRSLPSGTTADMLLVGGGAGYIRFRVNANIVASVTSTSSGSAVPSIVGYTLVRTQ
jgi:uncharacterized protein YjdB